MENLTTEYPIDTSELTKGSRVPAEAIEHAFNVRRDAERYRLVLLQVRKYIEWRLAERGLEVVTRTQRGDIVILTDSEAAPFTDSGFVNTIRRLGQMLRKQAGIDRAGLLDVERARHDRALSLNGTTYAGTRTARRKAVAARPRERVTPGLLPGKR